MNKPSTSDADTRRDLGPGLVWAHDVLVAGLVMAATVAVRYHFEAKPTPSHIIDRSALVFAAVCAVVFPLFRLHRGLWRYTSVSDVGRIARAVVIAVLLLLPVLFLSDRLQDFPRSVPPVAAVLVIAALSASRLGVQAAAHGRFSLAGPGRGRPGAVVVGSPAAAAAFLSATKRRGPALLRVLGLVTTDAAPLGRTVGGAEVLGGLPRLAAILQAQTAAEDAVPQVVVAEPRPSRALLDQVVAAAAEAGARVVRVRSDGGRDAATEPVGAADLLDRPPRQLDTARPRALIGGRTVLVTGAGGTIGSELTRQALAFEPRRLVLLDASEFNLYAIDRELREAGVPELWTVELGDVRDPARLTELFARERPEVVLHAAALKHVPLMELNPLEAVLTNVGGAVNVARLARDACEALVFISTDKAVNPTNVMGATKRVAERAVQAIAAGGRCRTSAVRFGNVLGSTGSVAPLFERQIAHGGPVTVTHPDMERYFMTVQEAASLVLQAASLPAPEGAAAGQVYVLDMGEPVRIESLARQMIGLHGLRPGVDIHIVHTGLRPGEKLSEEIFYDAETVRPTEADGVLAAHDPAREAWAALEPRVEALLAAARERDEAGAMALLQALEPAFHRR